VFAILSHARWKKASNSETSVSCCNGKEELPRYPVMFGKELNNNECLAINGSILMLGTWCHWIHGWECKIIGGGGNQTQPPANFGGWGEVFFAHWLIFYRKKSNFICSNLSAKRATVQVGKLLLFPRDRARFNKTVIRFYKATMTKTMMPSCVFNFSRFCN
jgi:hypothetical protein